MEQSSLESRSRVCTKTPLLTVPASGDLHYILASGDLHYIPASGDVRTRETVGVPPSSLSAACPERHHGDDAPEGHTRRGRSRIEKPKMRHEKGHGQWSVHHIIGQRAHGSGTAHGTASPREEGNGRDESKLAITILLYHY